MFHVMFKILSIKVDSISKQVLQVSFQLLVLKTNFKVSKFIEFCAHRRPVKSQGFALLIWYNSVI